MKITNKLPSINRFLTETEISEFVQNTNMSELTDEEIQLYKDYFYLVSTGGMATGAMTESEISDIIDDFSVDQLLEASYSDERITGAEGDAEYAGKTLKKIGITAVAGLGALVYVMRRKKAKKLVKVESKAKAAKAKAEVAFRKDNQGQEIDDKIEDLRKKKANQKNDAKSIKMKEKIDKQIENLQNKKEKTKESADKQLELANSKADQDILKVKEKIDDIIGEEDPPKEKASAPTKGAKESVSVSEAEDSVGGMMGNLKKLLYKSIRLDRVRGSAAAKTILLDGATKAQKKVIEKEIKALEDKEAKLKKEVDDLNNATEDAGTDDQKREVEKQTAELDADTAEETEETEETSVTPAAEKIEKEIVKIDTKIDAIDGKIDKVEDVEKKADDTGNDEVATKAAEVGDGFSKEKQKLADKKETQEKALKKETEKNTKK